MQRTYLIPSEICGEVVETGVKKASMKAIQLLLLGILAGMFIAFAAEGSNMAVHRLALTDAGLGKALAGVIFTTGLMLVLVAGGELFTGNTLMIASLFERRISLAGMLRNWLLVYTGNFLGSWLMAWLMVNSGLFATSDGGLGGYTIKVAAYKCGLTFSQAIILGILCNMLVCLAVWMAYGAKDMAGKLLAIYFPISLFITSGFEHSVANMYYIPAGILASANPKWVEMSGVTGHKLEALNWISFLTNNLIPVTIGNIIGGSLMVAVVYWLVYIKAGKSKAD
jgi:formate/nitrite transporter